MEIPHRGNDLQDLKSDIIVGQLSDAGDEPVHHKVELLFGADIEGVHMPLLEPLPQVLDILDPIPLPLGEGGVCGGFGFRGGSFRLRGLRGRFRRFRVRRLPSLARREHQQGAKDRKDERELAFH